MICTRPPQSHEELLERVQNIAGLKLGTLAAQLARPVPDDFRRAKGWTGQLLEQALGASATSQAEPDFMEIGVELKTLPINARGLPKETTYVCTVPLATEIEPDWESAWIKRKLSCVLWLPIEADPTVAIADRRIGSGILWQLEAPQETVLKQDWEEHMELISLGRIDEISAHHGTYLQIRPKAADNKALRDTTDEEGNIVKTLPRGFYLRTQFTAMLLAENYVRNL